MKSNVLPIPTKTFTVDLTGEDLETILFRLMGERSRIDTCIGKFQSALNPMRATQPIRTPAPATAGKRKLSPKARKKIAEAQKKRHAANRTKPAAGGTTEEPKTMGAGGVAG